MFKAFIKSRSVEILFFVMAAFAVYGRSLAHEFINWDDPQYVVFNQAITGFSWQHVREAFSNYYVGNYAPIHIISYMFDYTLWGLRPGGFLFTNIILHSLNSLLWYRMLLRWYGDRLIAYVAACLFLIHPVQVESVVWVSQRKNLLALLFFLIAWDCYCRYRRAFGWKGRAIYAVSVTSFALALLTKSVVVVFPLVLICYDFCFENGQERFRLKDKLPYFFLTAGGVVFAVLSQSQDLNGGRVGYHGGSAWYTLLTMLPVLCRYVLLVVWPTGLSALYSPLLHTSLDGTVIVAVAFLAVIVAGGVALYRRNRRSGFWALLWLIGLLPVLQIIPLNTLISDRYLYFPMLGVSALAGVAVAFLVKRVGERSVRAINAMCASVLILLALLAFMRTDVWKDSLTLWTDAVTKVPESARAWGNLGNAYHLIGAQQEAFDAYRQSLKLYPDNEQILYIIAMMYYDAGDYSGAQVYLKRLPKGFRVDGVVPLFGTEPSKL